MTEVDRKKLEFITRVRNAMIILTGNNISEFNTMANELYDKALVHTWKSMEAKHENN